MLALVLAHETECSAGRIGQRLAQRGFIVDTHVVTSDADRPDQANPFPDIESYDLIIPMGSVRSLMRRHEIASWIHDELDLIRRSHAHGTALLGVCFGGQLIAEALGGAVEVAPRTELGWEEIGDGDVPNPVGSGPWLQWHHDRFTPPPGSEVLARNDAAVQLIRIGRTVGTQFHPEVDVPHVATFLASTDDAYLAEYGTTREQLLADTRRHEAAGVERCHALVDWFLDEVAFPGRLDRVGSNTRTCRHRR